MVAPVPAVPVDDVCEVCDICRLLAEESDDGAYVGTKPALMLAACDMYVRSS